MVRLENEFGCVTVDVGPVGDRAAGVSLTIRSVHTGAVAVLDPLQLEALTEMTAAERAALVVQQGTRAANGNVRRTGGRDAEQD